MKYNGIELKEFTSDRPVVFDPPREMLVWGTELTEAQLLPVLAYIPGRFTPVIAEDNGWMHCAEIPEEAKPRRATNRELAKWLAQGNGERRFDNEYSGKDDAVFSAIEFTYDIRDADLPVDGCYTIRKWDDEEWHEPTADYMGLEE